HLVELVQPNREASRNPIFQLLFVQQHAPGADPVAGFALGAGRIEVGGLTFTPRATAPLDAQVDLAVEAFLTDQGELRCRLRYNRDLWNADTIARLAEHWQV